MRYDPRCKKCLLSRVLYEAELANASLSLKKSLIESSAKKIDELARSPIINPVLASIIHRHVYREVGCDDPYNTLKKESNKIAKKVLDVVSPSLQSFHDYVLASVIGNLFDYGVRGHEVSKDFLGTFNREYSRGLTIDDTEEILLHSHRIVYFTDNCGEIVFDALVLRYLHDQGSHITLVLRDKPILNDATLEDAVALGLGKFTDIITTTGSGCELGLNLSIVPEELKRLISDASLIISKGMANYESLTEYTDLPPVAYMMAVKCEPIAKLAGVPKGSKIAALQN